MKQFIVILLFAFGSLSVNSQLPGERYYDFHFALVDYQLPFHSVMAQYAYDTQIEKNVLTIEQKNGPDYIISLNQGYNQKWHEIKLNDGIISITYISDTLQPDLSLHIIRADAIGERAMNLDIQSTRNNDWCELMFTFGNQKLDLTYGRDEKEYNLIFPWEQLRHFEGRNLTCLLRKTCEPVFEPSTWKLEEDRRKAFIKTNKTNERLRFLADSALNACFPGELFSKHLTLECTTSICSIEPVFRKGCEFADDSSSYAAEITYRFTHSSYNETVSFPIKVMVSMLAPLYYIETNLENVVFDKKDLEILGETEMTRRISKQNLLEKLNRFASESPDIGLQFLQFVPQSTSSDWDDSYFKTQKEELKKWCYYAYKNPESSKPNFNEIMYFDACTGKFLFEVSHYQNPLD